MSTRENKLRIARWSFAVICSIVVSTSVIAQDAATPGVLSGVGGPATALNNAAAPQGNAATPMLAPPNAAYASVANVKDVRTLLFSGDTDFAMRQKLHERITAELNAGASAADALTAVNKALIGQGFYLVRLVPSYDAANQALTVRVDAGVFGNVSVAFKDREGNGLWFSKRQIERRFKDLKPGDAFDYRLLYRRLSGINNHPDLTLDTNISVRQVNVGDGSINRFADLELVATESFPLHGSLEINNYLSKELGRWQANATLQYLNLTRADDVLSFSHSMTLKDDNFYDLWTLAASYMRPHHIWRGGNFTLYGGFSDMDNEVVPRLNLQGQGYFGGLMATFNLIDNDSYLLALSAGILCRYMEDQWVFNGTWTFSERKNTVLPFTLSLAYSDRKSDFLGGRNFAALSGVYNVWSDKHLDSSYPTVDQDNYTIARLQYSRLQPLFGGKDGNQNPIHQWTLFLKAEAQYSYYALIPAEKLFLGGYRSVRGYDTQCALGDTGVYGTAEFRTPIMLDLISHFFLEKRKTPIDRLQFLAFVDAGYAQQENPLIGEKRQETMLSAGVGARIALTEYSQFRFDWGAPLLEIDSDPDSHKLRGRFYISGQLQF